MIVVENLSIRFPDSPKPCIDNRSFSLSPGECLLLTGATGSGKSTLLRALMGLIPRHIAAEMKGQITLDGVEVSSLTPARISRRIGFLSQNPFTSCVTDTVEDEVAFALESHGVERSRMKVLIEESLTRFGISHLRQRSPRTLSTGEVQKVGLAAVTVLQPDYLLLDEPISALDEATAADVLLFLRDYARSHGILISEHRTHLIGSLATRTIECGDRAEATSPLPLLPHAKVIIGPNGSGKTTYLERYIASAKHQIGYVPQNPIDILLTQSIEDECALSPGSREVFAKLAPHIPFTTHPRDLSEGEKLLLALSIASRHGVKELVLDEPTRGLDLRLKREIIEFLATLAVPITIATHDHDLIHAAQHNVVNIGDIA